MYSNESKSKKRIRARRPGRRFVGSGLAAAVVLTALTGITGAACARSGTDRGSEETATVGRESAVRAAPRPVRVARFERPVEVKTAPGYRRLLFVLEQPGRVMVLAGGRKLRRPFLDIGSRVSYGGEEGLLSIAFPPDYRRSGRFYVYYTDRNGDIQIDEYRRGTDLRARPGSRRSVLRIAHPTNSNHNGGQMHFLGNDLFISTGDGGGGGDPEGNAQNRNSLLGKMLRMDPRRSGSRPYSVPASNPFPLGGGGRSPIFATGLRNPFRWSFDLRDPSRPRITIGDVGQSEWEEVNYLTLDEARGGNFGWSYFEGFAPYPGNGPEPTDPIEPIAVLSHSSHCSVTGGIVARDPGLGSLNGRYLFADFCRDRLLSLPGAPEPRTSPKVTGVSIPQVTSFTERADRKIFITSLEDPDSGQGWLYRLDAAG